MKNNLKVFALIGASIVLTVLGGCTSINVEAGQEAVLIDKPYIFGKGGVRPEPVKPGNVKTWLSTDYVMVSMVPEAHQIKFDDFSSKDHVLLDLHATAILRVTDPVTLIKKFGKDWFNNNVEGPLSQMIRDVVKTQTVGNMMSDPTIAEEMDHTVSNELDAYMKEQHIPIVVVSVTLGRVKPNPIVLEQMNATAAQQQRMLTERASAKAETARKMAETKRAEADNAYRLALGYTTQQYAEMQIANIQAEACKNAKQCIIVPAGANVLAATQKK